MPTPLTTLADLEKLLKNTRSAKELYGSDPHETYRAFVRLAHPDRNPGDKKAEDLFKEVTKLFESLEEKPVVIKSPKRVYTIVKLLKVGDVSDIHLAQSETDDGILHDYIVKISRIDEAYKMLDNERKIVGELLTAAGDTTYRKYFPTLVESFPAHDKIQKRVNVFTAYSSNDIFTGEEIHEKIPALDGKHLAWMFKRMLTAVGFAHRQGYVHGAVLPCHVRFDIKNHGVQLTSWGHAVPLGSKITTISKKYKDWYPPEVLEKKAATPSTDIYLVAKTILYLAGVDPNKAFKLDTKQVPLKEQRFFQSCVLPGAKMRPSDAWKLEEEFTELLKEQYGLHKYGKPKFVPLIMPE